MSEILCKYLGDLKCNAIHLSSGKEITTDAPLDHYGKGQNFSPTDLLATSLGTCLLTIMGIHAKKSGWELKDINLKVKKIMTDNSERRIKKLIIDIFLPKGLTEEKYDFLIKASNECPVTRNLCESLSLNINWHYENIININPKQK